MQTLITKDIIDSLTEMLNYLADEDSNYESHIEEGGDPESHIWTHRERVREWLEAFSPQQRFYYIQDPGHGWLSVPRSLINALGLADHISQYSYEHLGDVYLEEDCDMSKFLAAYKLRYGFSPILDDLISRGEWVGRNSYAPYRP